MDMLKIDTVRKNNSRQSQKMAKRIDNLERLTVKHFEQLQRQLRKVAPTDNQVQPMLGDGFRNEYTPGIQPR